MHLTAGNPLLLVQGGGGTTGEADKVWLECEMTKDSVCLNTWSPTGGALLKACGTARRWSFTGNRGWAWRFYSFID